MDRHEAELSLRLAGQASVGATGPDARDSLKILDEHLDDLTASIDWFIDAGRTDDALRLANSLYRFWITKQRFADGTVWFDRVLDAPGGGALLRTRATLNAGFMPFWMGDDERAAELFTQALAEARRVADAPLTSQALGGMSRVALRTDVAEGRRLATDALAVSEAAGDEPGRSNALHLLGVGAQIAGDLPEARDWMIQRLAIVRASGNQFLIASEAANLSMVERQLGELDAADALAREALEIEARTGDRFTTPFALSGLAAIATARHEFERAAILLGAAEAMLDAQQMAWPPDERPHYERLVEDLPEALGPEAFEHARHRGQEMGQTEAVAFALAREWTSRIRAPSLSLPCEPTTRHAPGSSRGG